MDSFYVTLPSDSSMEIYPENGPAKYTTVLQQGIGLVGDYEVALTEIQFKFDFHNFVSEQLSFEVLIDEDEFEKLVTVDERFYDPEAANRSDNVVLQFHKLYDELYALLRKTVGHQDFSHTQEDVIQTNVSYVKSMVNYADGKTLQSVDQWIYRRRQILEDAFESIKVYMIYIANLSNLPLKERERANDIYEQLRMLVVTLRHMLKRVDRLKQPDSSTPIVLMREKRDDDGEPQESTAESIATTTSEQTNIPNTANLTIMANDEAKAPRVESLNIAKFSHISTDGAALMSLLTGQLAGLKDAITTLPVRRKNDHDSLFLKSSKVYIIVPPPVIPSIIEKDKRIFRVPVNFPSGYYKDPQTLVALLNAELRYACIVRNLDKLVYFRYDARTAKISLYMHEKVAVNFTDINFASQLGFEHAMLDPRVLKNTTGNKTVIYHQLWQLMYIYSDVADYSHVGHSMSQLLRVMPATGSANEYTVQRFDAPHYVPVIKNAFGTLEVQLSNEFGDDYSIKSGKTIVKLHFRPRVKNIF